MALKETCSTLKKVSPDEPIFVIRARDAVSAETVCEWITKNINTAPPEKLREALDCAIAMRGYPGKKWAD